MSRIAPSSTEIEINEWHEIPQWNQTLERLNLLYGVFIALLFLLTSIARWRHLYGTMYNGRQSGWLFIKDKNIDWLRWLSKKHGYWIRRYTRRLNPYQKALGKLFPWHSTPECPISCHSDRSSVLCDRMQCQLYRPHSECLFHCFHRAEHHLYFPMNLRYLPVVVTACRVHC